MIFTKLQERDQRNIKQGIELGRSQGIELGVSKVIRSMLSKNIPDEQIIFLTECSPEYLEKVKASMDCGDNPEGNDLPEKTEKTGQNDM